MKNHIVTIISALVFVLCFLAALTTAVAQQAGVRQSPTTAGLPQASGTWELPLPATPVPAPERTVFTYEAKGAKPRQHVRLQLSNYGNLTITYGDGASGYSWEREYQESEIYHLEALARLAGFPSLKPRYGMARLPGDIQDTITYSPDEGKASKTVTIFEEAGKGEIPAGVLDMIAAFRRLVSVDALALPPFPAPRQNGQQFSLTYSYIAMGAGGDVQIDSTGLVRYYSLGKLYFSYHMEPALFGELSQRIAESHFFEPYVPSTPTTAPDPSATVLPLPSDLPGELIILTMGGQSASEEGTSNIADPNVTQPLANLLYSIFDSLYTRLAIDYQERTIAYDLYDYKCECYYDMDVDGTGDVFIDGQRAGQLSDTERQDLIQLFRQAGWSDLQANYSPLDDPADTRRSLELTATLDGEMRTVKARSGDDVPAGLKEIATRLASLYTRFANATPITLARADLAGEQVGMPKAGGGPDIPTLALGTFAVGMCLVGGCALRRASYTRI